MIIILSVALTFGSELIDLNYSFFTVYIVAFVFCFGLMEIGMLLVNNAIKKKGGKFFVFCFSFLALGYIFNTIVGFLFNDKNHKVVLDSLKSNEIAISDTSLNGRILMAKQISSLQQLLFKK